MNLRDELTWVKTFAGSVTAASSFSGHERFHSNGPKLDLMVGEEKMLEAEEVAAAIHFALTQPRAPSSNRSMWSRPTAKGNSLGNIGSG